MFISEEDASALKNLKFKLLFGLREAKVKVFRPFTPDDDDADEIDSANKLFDNMQLDAPSTSNTKGMLKVVQINLRHSPVSFG